MAKKEKKFYNIDTRLTESRGFNIRQKSAFLITSKFRFWQSKVSDRKIFQNSSKIRTQSCKTFCCVIYANVVAVCAHPETKYQGFTITYLNKLRQKIGL